MPVQIIRGVYDGKTIRPLPTETLPEVEGEIPVDIVFLERRLEKDEARRLQREAISRLRAARDRTLPLDCSIKDLIEQGRER